MTPDVSFGLVIVVVALIFLVVFFAAIPTVDILLIFDLLLVIDLLVVVFILVGFYFVGVSPCAALCAFDRLLVSI